MPAEMAEKQAANRDEARAPGEGVSVEQVTGPAQMIPPPGRQSTHRRRLLMGLLGALVLAAAGVFGIPWIRLSLNTVSTDDAYVNGHVPFVAPALAARLRGS
jgi:multidrug resistance efflux pump